MLKQNVIRKKDEDKLNIKNKKGVSLIMLVIAIAMMAIIVSFAVFNSQNTTPEAKLASTYSSLKAIKDSCDNALMLMELDPNAYDEYYFFGNNIQYRITDLTELNKIAVNCGLPSSSSFSDRTYIIKPAETEDEKRVLANLELKSVANTYVVDLENENYYIVGGIDLTNGTKAYEYKDIMKSYQLLTN